MVQIITQEIGYTTGIRFFCGVFAVSSPSLVEQFPDGKANEALEVRGNADQDPLDLIGAELKGLMSGFAVASRRTSCHCQFHFAVLVRRLAELRKSKEISYLRPDAKSQWRRTKTNQALAKPSHGRMMNLLNTHLPN